MGYYTQYSLTVRPRHNGDASSLIESVTDFELPSGVVLLSVDDAYAMFYEAEYIDGLVYFYSEESAKWYDSKNDIITLSRLHHNLLFSLEGKGEDDEDRWILHAINGHYETINGRIIFDNSNLEDPAEVFQIADAPEMPPTVQEFLQGLGQARDDTPDW